jgi:uncharacterized membrane protein
MKREGYIKFICAFFIFLFVYTGVSKLLHFELFQIVLKQSPLISSYAKTMSLALPVTELLVALLLLIPAFRIAGLYCSLLLMVIFTGYIAYMLAFSPKLPCSCGGVIAKLSWTQHLILNCLLTGLLVTAIYFINKYRQWTGDQ